MFVIQDGHHLRSHIVEAVESGRAAGAILSPADQSPETLSATAETILQAGATLAIDPQAVVVAVVDANPKKLLRHPHIDAVGIRARELRPKAVRKIVEQSIQLQVNNGCSVIISPTVALSSLDQRWAQVAQEFAETSMEVHGELELEQELLLCAAIRDQLLRDDRAVDDLLDELTRYEVDGFYLLGEVDIAGDLDVAINSARGCLKLVSELTARGRYEVWSGYTGFAGMAHSAAGASAVASGWFLKQQWWSPSHWEAGTGGGQAPAPRIALESISGEARWDTELPRILAAREGNPDLVARVLAGAGDLAAYLRGASRISEAPPDRPRMVQQLVDVLSAQDANVLQADDPRQAAFDHFSSAQTLHGDLKSAGLELDAVRAGRRTANVWAKALESY